MNDVVDMARFVEAKSDQLNADDLIGTPRTVVITKVTGHDGDQPVSIHYEGDRGKPFRPCKTIRRVLLAVWGRNASDYVGRSMTLYRDESVKFGGLNVGGIRISHMSHIEKEAMVVVMKSKGKKEPLKIKPLVMQQQQQPKEEPAQQDDPVKARAMAIINEIKAAPNLAALEAIEATMDLEGLTDQMTTYIDKLLSDSKAKG